MIERAVSEQIQATVRAVVSTRLEAMVGVEGQDSVDLVCDATVRVLAALRKSKEQEGSTKIDDVVAYARRVAEHEVHRYLATKNPRRAAVAAKLRYIARKPGSKIVTLKGRGRLVGIALQAHAETGAQADLQRLTDLSRTPFDVAGTILPCGFEKASELPRTVLALLEWLGGEAPFNRLVSILATLTAQTDSAVISIDQGELDVLDSGSARGAHQKIYLEAVWQGLTSLQREHRQALLLNMRDASGQGDVRLFTLLGIASIDDVARAVELPRCVFDRVWPELPLPDSTVAVLMQTDPAKVFGYRSSARRSLSRILRRAGWDHAPT